MTDRKRDPLPQGYQFGDASGVVLRAVAVGKTGISIRFVRQYDVDADRKPRLSFDELRLWLDCMERARRGWNVIEGEDH